MSNIILLAAVKTPLDLFIDAAGFIALITVFILFRSALRRHRGRSVARIRSTLAPRPIQAALAECPNCGNPLPDGAKSCGRCGVAISTPNSVRQPSPVLFYIVIGLLGAIGLGVIIVVRDVKPAAKPPQVIRP